MDSILRRLEEGVRLSVSVRRNKLVTVLGVIKHVEYQCKLYYQWTSFVTYSEHIDGTLLRFYDLGIQYIHGLTTLCPYCKKAPPVSASNNPYSV